MKASIASVAAAGLAACATSGTDSAKSGFLSADTVFLGRLVESEEWRRLEPDILIWTETTLLTFEVVGQGDKRVSVYDDYERCEASDAGDGAHLVFVEPVDRKSGTDEWLRVYACPKVGPDAVRHLLLHEKSLATQRN